MMGGWFQKLGQTPLAERIKKDKKLLLLLAAGILGMLLLLATELFPAEANEAERHTESAEQAADSRQTYISEIEGKLEEMISAISGAGRTKVMVTLENSEESVWATQGNQTRESESGGERYSAEDEYVLIQSSSSEEGGLLLKIIQPKIRGVAIVCDGADNVYVREKITSTVASVLDVSTAKISIAKMASEQ